MGLVREIAALQNYETYKELTWEGGFDDYLEVVRKQPGVTRTAYQRLYDMVLSHGTEEYVDNKKKLVRYKFFQSGGNGKDEVFGLDVPLMRLMNVFKSAAQGYGTERRIILLHGPVGSAKSTIVPSSPIVTRLHRYASRSDGSLSPSDAASIGARPVWNRAGS